MAVLSNITCHAPFNTYKRAELDQASQWSTIWKDHAQWLVDNNDTIKSVANLASPRNMATFRALARSLPLTLFFALSPPHVSCLAIGPRARFFTVAPRLLFHFAANVFTLQEAMDGLSKRDGVL